MAGGCCRQTIYGGGPDEADTAWHPAPLDIVGINHVAAFQMCLITDDVVAEHAESDAFVLQQLQQIRRIGARQNHPAGEVAALNDLWQVQLGPGNVGRIVIGEEHHIPTACCAMRFRAAQDAGMKGV